MRVKHQLLPAPTRLRDGAPFPPTPGTDVYCTCGVRVLKVGTIATYDRYLKLLTRYYTRHINAVDEPSHTCTHQTCVGHITDFELGLCEEHSTYARVTVLRIRREQAIDPPPVRRRPYRSRR